MEKNKIYYIIKHKGIISAVFAVLTLLFGSFGFYHLDGDHLWYEELTNALLKSFQLFGLNFPTVDEFNAGTVLGSLFAVLTVGLTAILFFFKDQINRQIFNNISKEKHISIFGLGEVSRTFLEDTTLDTNIIIIEKDAQYAEEYRAKGYGVEIGDAFSMTFLQKHLNFTTMEYALISFGCDKLNIEFSKKIISLYKKQNIETPL